MAFDSPKITAAITQAGQATGEFDRLFFDFHKVYLQRAKLHQRKVFELGNPLLPKLTPLDNPSLWYQITDFKLGNTEGR